MAIGIALLVRGLRGRAVDDHPVCRRCRFDLVGLPATSARCSECGADLSLPHAVLTGNRRRRPGLILTGALFLLPSLAGLVLFALVVFSNIAWIEHAPHWYLMRQAGSPTAAVHDPALAELARRLAASSLSDPQIAAMVDAGLALQADRSATWVPEWGNLIESARAAGKVPGEKWQQYLSNAPAVSLSLRPEIRRGDKVVVRVNELAARCGTHSSLWARIRCEVQPDSDLIEPRNGGSMGTSLGPHGNGSFGHDYELPRDALAAAPYGPKLIHMKVLMDLFNGGSSAPDRRPPDATATFDLRGTWSLVPADAPTVRAIADPAARPAVERGIRVEEISLDSRDYVHVQIRIDKLPVPIAYRIILRADGREWRTSSIYAQVNANSGWSTGGEAKGLAADRVDVVLRPDPAVATGSVDMHDYWNEEVVIKNVPVKRPAK